VRVWADLNHPARESMRTLRSVDNQRLAQLRRQCTAKNEVSARMAQETSIGSHTQCRLQRECAQRAPRRRALTQGRESHAARRTAKAEQAIARKVCTALRLGLGFLRGSPPYTRCGIGPKTGPRVKYAEAAKA
jgi:hypothetical protein